MPSIRQYATILTLLAPLALSACGDGWVVQKYSGFPYAGNGVNSDERTAGYGVEYVRASMMPSKGPMTQAVTKPAPPPTVTPPETPPVKAAAPAPVEPVKSAVPVYKKAQQK